MNLAICHAANFLAGMLGVQNFLRAAGLGLGLAGPLVASSENTPARLIGQTDALQAAAIAPTITQQPIERTNPAIVGDYVFFSLTAAGDTPLSYQWKKNGVSLPGATDATIAFFSVSLTDAGDYRCTVANPAGSVDSDIVHLTVLDPATALQFTTRPTPQVVSPGATVTLTAAATATSGGNVTYLWAFNNGGSSIATGPTLTLNNVTTAQAGTYTVQAGVSIGSGYYTLQQSATVTVVPPGGTVGRMLGISTRCDVGSGNDVLVAGLALQGSTSRRILVRGVGPGLKPYMAPGATLLADPEIELFDISAHSLAKNDNWESAGGADIAAAHSALGLFPLEAGAKDAALLLDLAPGAYTVHLRDKSGGRGIGLAEFYEVGTAGNATRLLGISSRARVRPGDGLLVPGIVVEGSTSRRLLVRGLGPKLAEYGITDYLPDPALKVLRYENGGWTTMATNDNWMEDLVISGLIERPIEGIARNVGLSALPANSLDAALVVTLPPGVYTVQLGSGQTAPGSGTGVALVEVYDVP